MKGTLGTPVAYAIFAFKGALLANSYGDDLNMTAPVFGSVMQRNTKRFQKDHMLVVDGEIGPKTSAKLFNTVFITYEEKYGIPNRLVCKACHLESAVDPGAVGYSDIHDLGIFQINTVMHPTLTVDQLFDAEWSINYYAQNLVAQFTRLKDWDAAVASWNVGGGGAAAWSAAGKPSTLFEPWFLDADGNPIDLGARATNYVRLVKAQSC